MDGDLMDNFYFTTSSIRQPRDPEMTVWNTRSGVDKMSVPDDFKQMVDMCRLFYDRDGIAHSTIEKQIEIGINGYTLDPGTCDDNEMLIYSHINDTIYEFLKEAALEYLLSGLVVPDVVWETVPGPQIAPHLRKSYTLPTTAWLRDPKTLELKKTPIPKRVVVYVKVPDKDIEFIQNNGVYADGTEDKETYNILKREYPEFVRAVKSGKIKFKLENPTIIRRYVKSGEIWPTPYLEPALELFMHKRNLRKMDYATASRVIQAIQLFKMGSDEFPLTADNEDDVEDLKAQMQWRQSSGNIERVFQLFSNHTLDIEWITPDVSALLDEGKYRSINEDIFMALGLPRVVVTGEALRTGTSNSELALLPPTEMIESFRNALLEYPKQLYKEIRERNDLSGIPDPAYPPIRLQKVETLMTLGKDMYEHGVISSSSWAEMGRFDYETEVKKMVRERELRKESGIDERPDVPYSPQPKNNDGKNTEIDENE